MNAILLFQSVVLAKLLAEPALININSVSLRAVQVSSEAEIKRVWLKARNGKAGAGVVVGIPSVEHNFPNVAGPERKLLLPVSVFAQPSVNALASTGTGLEAEEIVDLIDALLARFQVEGLGTIYCDATMPNLETAAGVIRYDMIFVCENARDEITRCEPVTLAEAPALTLTLTCATAGAAIYYTTDGSLPGPDAATGLAAGTATLYSAPFAVTSGARVSVAAYKTGLAGSDIRQYLIT